MRLSVRIRNFVLKLQGLPETQKKIAFFLVMALVALFIGFFGIIITKKNIVSISQSLKALNFPKIGIPNDKYSDDIQNILNNPETIKTVGSALDNLGQVQTTDWKTYTNDQYNFEIKYPDKWYFKELEKGIVEEGIYFSPYSPDGIDGGIVFTNEALSISVSPVVPQSSLLKFIENYLNLLSATKFETETIEIGGINGLRVKIACESAGCNNPHWFVVKSNNVYIFSSNLSSKNKIDIFEQMISTFKFTNTTQ